MKTTDEHRVAQPQPKRISPQRTRRFRPWERTLPACQGVQHPARRMRALPGARGGKSLAACKGFRVSSTNSTKQIRGIRGRAFGVDATGYVVTEERGDPGNTSNSLARPTHLTIQVQIR